MCLGKKWEKNNMISLVYDVQKEKQRFGCEDIDSSLCYADSYNILHCGDEKGTEGNSCRRMNELYWGS